MAKLVTDLIAYLAAVFVETKQKVFTLFDILGIVLFAYPKLAQGLVNDESLARTIGGLVFFVSFLLANFALYRKLAEVASYQAHIRLEVLKRDFSHSHGSRHSPFPDVSSNPYGFNKQGLPDWASLWASIKIANVGCEEGQLSWELDKAKTKLPPLFASDRIHIEFCPPVSLAARSPSGADFFLDVPLTERDPHIFAQSLKALIKSKRGYQIVLRYKTRRVDGESKPQQLCIKGDFQSFYQAMLKYWDENGFKDLMDLAHII